MHPSLSVLFHSQCNESFGQGAWVLNLRQIVITPEYGWTRGSYCKKSTAQFHAVVIIEDFRLSINYRLSGRENYSFSCQNCLPILWKLRFSAVKYLTAKKCGNLSIFVLVHSCQFAIWNIFFYVITAMMTFSRRLSYCKRNISYWYTNMNKYHFFEGNVHENF